MSDLAQSLLLTGALAGTTTIFLLIIALPLSWWLAQTTHKASAFIEALVALPLVLPPTVLGFYLLLAMAEKGWLGQIWGWLVGSPLAFTFAGLVIASIIYSLPFVSQPLTSSFRNTPNDLLDAASLMGISPTRRFADAPAVMATALALALNSKLPAANSSYVCLSSKNMI